MIRLVHEGSAGGRWALRLGMARPLLGGRGRIGLATRWPTTVRWAAEALPGLGRSGRIGWRQGFSERDSPLGVNQGHRDIPHT